MRLICWFEIIQFPAVLESNKKIFERNADIYPWSQWGFKNKFNWYRYKSNWYIVCHIKKYGNLFHSDFKIMVISCGKVVFVGLWMGVHGVIGKIVAIRKNGF